MSMPDQTWLYTQQADFYRRKVPYLLIIVYLGVLRWNYRLPWDFQPFPQALQVKSRIIL